MHQVRSIIQYLSKGYSLRAISRELHMSRKTITEYSIRLKSHGIGLSQLQQLSDSQLAAIVYAASMPVMEDERQKDFQERAACFLSELNPHYAIGFFFGKRL